MLSMGSVMSELESEAVIKGVSLCVVYAECDGFAGRVSTQ